MRDLTIRPGSPHQELKRAPDQEAQLKKACREFESVFTYELLKSMRRTIEKCDLFHGGQGEEMFESLLDQELSKNMTGLGKQSLAALLYQQFRRGAVNEPVEGEDLQQSRDGTVSTLCEKPPPPYTCGEDLQQSRDGTVRAPLNPLSEGRLSSMYGWRKDPFTGEDQFHHGVDLAAPEGTPVRAPEGGKVIMSAFREGYGNIVVLDHGRGLTTLYAHNRENKVKEGDHVKKGGLVATVGSTGRSTGPHLHFEVKRNGTRQDPLFFVSAGKSGI